MGLAFLLSKRQLFLLLLLHSLVGGRSGVPDVTTAKIPAAFAAKSNRVAGAISRVRDAGRLGFVPCKSTPTFGLCYDSFTNTSSTTSAISIPLVDNHFGHSLDIDVSAKLDADPFVFNYPTLVSGSPVSYQSGSSLSDDEDDTDSESGTDVSSLSSIHSNTCSVLERVFPDLFNNDNHGIIENVFDELWDGSILDETSSNGERTLYIEPTDATCLNANENIIDLIEQADEDYDCTSIVICLHKDSTELSSVVHSLMYAGGSIVSHPRYAANPEYVLIGVSL